MFRMNVNNDMIVMLPITRDNASSQRLESFSHWTPACRAILGSRDLAHVAVRQARMHPQSEGGPVLGLHSCTAPIPRATLRVCRRA